MGDFRKLSKSLGGFRRGLGFGLGTWGCSSFRNWTDPLRTPYFLILFFGGVICRCWSNVELDSSKVCRLGVWEPWAFRHLRVLGFRV